MTKQMGSLSPRGILAFVALGGLILAACCPPNCPPTVAPPRPQSWDSMLDQSAYDEVVEQTSAVIDAGEGAEFYAEARLYRGLAELRRNGDLESARKDLAIAEEFADKLTTIDPTMEKVLLLRGQMVLSAALAVDDEDISIAEQYRDKAIELAPDQREAIEEEFERAIKER